MKIFITKITFLFFLFSIGIISAQENDAEATLLLDAAKNKIDQMNAFSFDFDINIHRGSSDELQSGTYIAKGEKYLIETKDVKLMSDGKYSYSFRDNDKSIEIYDIDKTSTEINMMKGPSNILSFYKTNTFTYQMLPQVDQNNIIAFKPIDKENGIVKIVLAISTDNDLQSCQIFMRDATNYRLDIKKFKADPTTDDETFVFNEGEYPDADVEDLRLD